MTGLVSLYVIISFFGAAADIAGILNPKGFDFFIEVPAPLKSFFAPPRLGQFWDSF